MKVTDILRQVVEIQKMDDVDQQDDAKLVLYCGVLRALASGAKGAKDMAAAALMLETE